MAFGNNYNRALFPVVFFALGASDVIAAEWSITTKVNQRFEIDDNIRMRTTGGSTTFGSTTSPESRYRYRSPVLDLNVFGRFDFSRFNESIFNSEDQTFRSVSTYTTQRSVWGLNADLTRDSTRTSEVTDTGNFETIATRLSYSLQPSYAYQLSQRDSVRFNVGYTDVGYDTSNLTDYKYYTAGGSWDRRLSQSTVMGLSASASRQESDNGTKSTSYSAQGGVSHSFAPRLQVNAFGGGYLSSVETSVGDASGSGFQFSAGVDYMFDEVTSLSASASQSISPSGGGSSRQRRVFSLSADHRFLPRLTFSVSASLQQDSDPNSNTSASDRLYMTASPSVRWQVTQDWDLSASYRYRRQEVGGGPTADSNAGVVTLVYHPRAWFIAR